MLSSRPYYSPQVEFYRSSDGGHRMSLGQNSPLVDHYDTVSQLSRRTTPSSEADKPGGGLRKRVPVACERCRKRKIKCSGDQGGGCSNCIQAGQANTCQFLRVQSIATAELMTHAARCNISPYAVRYHPYSYSSPCRYPYASSPSSYSPGNSTYQSVQNGVDYTSYGGPSQCLSWTRSNSYASPYSAYEPEPTSTYNSQPPSYMLPNTDPMTNGNLYLANPYSTKSHSSQGWPEQSSSTGNSQSASQMMAASYSLPSSDSLLTYNTPASTSLKTELPYQPLSSQQPPALNSDRTLPTPAARPYASSTVSTLESLPMSALSHRSSIGSGWQTDISSSSSHISSHISCSSVGGSQDFGTDRPVTHRDPQDLTYGYLGYGNSPQSTLPSSGLSTVINNTQSSQHPLPTVSAELGSQRYRTVSNETSHDSPGGASSSYGYTGATVTRSSQTRTASGQLSNGATYTRAKSSLSRRESASEECGADCSGYQPSSNRASIASINNMSSY